MFSKSEKKTRMHEVEHLTVIDFYKLRTIKLKLLSMSTQAPKITDQNSKKNILDILKDETF